MIRADHKKTETPGKPCLVFLGFWSLCLLVTVGVLGGDVVLIFVVGLRTYARPYYT